MTNPKGTWAETKVTNYLAQWFPNIMRLVKKGAKDEGDLFGVPRAAIEVKYRGTYNIPQWLRETAIEQGHAGQPRGFLIVKPRGIGETRMGDWWVIQPLAQWAQDYRRLTELEDASETI